MIHDISLGDNESFGAVVVVKISVPELSCLGNEDSGLRGLRCCACSTLCRLSHFMSIVTGSENQLHCVVGCVCGNRHQQISCVQQQASKVEPHQCSQENIKLGDGVEEAENQG